VKALRAKGYDVTGHDPVVAPGKPRKADVVLLVYILNVLTSPCEREHVFKQAWEHARKRLIVAVRVDKQAPGKPCGDGVMTRSGTFQHHFTHEALLALCRKLAPRAKVQKLDPGVVAVSR